MLVRLISLLLAALVQVKVHGDLQTLGLDEPIIVSLEGELDELGQHASELVVSLLETTSSPLSQLSSLFELSFVAQNNTSTLKTLLQTQRQAAKLSTIGVVFENGDVIGFTEDSFFVRNSTAVCLNSTYCALQFTPDESSLSSTIDLALIFSRYNYTLNYIESWTELFDSPLSNHTNGFLRLQRIQNSLGHVIGCGFVALSQDVFRSSLFEQFSQESNAVVFAATDSGAIFGWSLSQTVPEDPRIHKPVDSALEYFSLFTAINLKPYTQAVYSGCYIQRKTYPRDQFVIHVFVSEPTSPEAEYSETGSTAFKIVCAVVGIAFIATVGVCVWVLRFRKLRLWQFSHPPLLTGILLTLLACLFYSVLIVTTPSDQHCNLRFTVSVVAATLMCNAVLGKALWFLTMSEARQFVDGVWPLNVKLSLLVAVLSCVCMGTVVGLKAKRDPSLVVLSLHSLTGSDLALTKLCHYDRSEWGVAGGILVCFLALVSTRAAFIARNSSRSHGESRGLAVVALQSLLLCIGCVVIEVTQSVDQSEPVSVVAALCVVWFVMTCLLTLFLPRIFRQLTVGDMTVEEMRAMIQKVAQN